MKEREIEDSPVGDPSADARPRREARAGAGGVLWYEDDDPRCRLSTNELRALPLVVAGVPTVEIALRLKLSPNRVSRWRRSPRFRKAVVAEREEPTSPRFALQARMRGPLDASRWMRRALAAGNERTEREEES